MTPAQRKALQLAVDSGGEIVTAGLDRQPVSRRVAFALHTQGLLASRAPRGQRDELWTITAAGRAALQAQPPQA